MVICLERDADLHMAQLMPLPLTDSCFSKTQIGFTFLVPAHLGRPSKKAVKRVCVCLRGAQKRRYRQSLFWHILEFHKRSCICSAYHWTNCKLATVEWVTMPCQTQTITLISLLSSNHHHHQHYISCYEYEMYHLCQYESDTSSANCKHNNINIDALVKTAATLEYIQGGQKDCFWESITL